MTNYFYCLGFVYIADVLKSLWDSFKPVKADNVLNISDGMEMTELMAIKEKAQQKSKTNKSFSSFIIGMILFVWAIAGYKFNTPEKNWFLCDVILVILYWSIFSLFIILITIRSINRSKPNVLNVDKKPTINIPLNQILYIGELVTVSYILFHHFILS